MHTFKNPNEAWDTIRILVKPVTPTHPRVFQTYENELRHKRERVDGGEVLWKPVDKAASMLLAKVPDINKPNYETNQTRQTNTYPPAIQSGLRKQTVERGIYPNGAKRKKHQSMDVGRRGGGVVGKESGHHREKAQTTNSLNMIPDILPTDKSEAASYIGDAADKARALSKMEGQLQEIAASLKNALADVKGLYTEVNDFTADATKSTRATRMAAVSELTQFASSLREVRKFFLGSEYEQESKRLRDFVELCERLNALKTSGFLDAVADTMIRLADPK